MTLRNKNLVCFFFLLFLACVSSPQLAYAQGQDEKSVEKNKRIRQRNAGVGKSNGTVAYGKTRKKGNGETARATYQGTSNPKNKNLQRNLDDDRGVFSGTDRYVNIRKFRADKDNQRAKHEGKISLKKVRKQDNNRYALNDANTGYEGEFSTKKVKRFRANAQDIDDQRASHEGNISLKRVRRQDNNRYALNDANSSYDGSISMKKIKRFRANAQDIDDQRASHEGNISLKGVRRQDNNRYALNEATSGYDGSLSMRKIKKFRENAKDIDDQRASYAGNISVRKLNKFKERARDIDDQRASYAGNISVRKLNKWKRDNDIKDYDMATYDGSVRIRVRDLKHPYRSIASRRSSIPNRNINTKYNSQKLFARRVSKSQLANYQKEGPRKLKHSRGETEMWKTGGIAKKGEDGKVTTVKMRPNSRDDQRKELLQKSKAERKEARKKGPKDERTGESNKNAENTPTPPPPKEENKE